MVKRSLSPFPPRTTIFVGGEIDVLDAKLQAFEYAQPRTVKQHRRESRRPIHCRYYLLHFFRCQHHRQSDRPLGAGDRIQLLERRSQHFAVKE
jgi:hypothetical protein